VSAPAANRQGACGMGRWTRARGPLVAVLLAVVIASCASARPAVALTVNGVAVSGAAAGSWYGNRCGGGGGHGTPSPNPVTVPARDSLALEVATAPEVTEIVGSLFTGDAPTSEPVTFTFAKDSSRHIVPRVAPGTYYLLVRVEWSRLFEGGSETYAYRLIVREP
jgi:hypothetical protein